MDAQPAPRLQASRQATRRDPGCLQLAPRETCSTLEGPPGWLSGKESACNAGDGVLSPGREDPLERKTATDSSILALETPQTEEPGGLQSTGSQRVGHD